MILTTRNFELFKEKPSTLFDKALTPFLKTFLYQKQLFDAMNVGRYLLDVVLDHNRDCAFVKMVLKHNQDNKSLR